MLFRSSVVGTDAGTIKAGVAGTKIAVAAATGSKQDMNDFYTILETAGIELPQAAKDFLTCAYNAMGDYLYKILGMIVEGKFEEAGKAAAPYLVNCSIQSLAGQLSQDSYFRKWAKAAGAATSAYIKASNASAPPPPPKVVPVTGSKSQGCGVGYVAGPKGECLRDESGCGPNQYKSLDGKCKPKGGSTENYQPQPSQVRPAADTNATNTAQQQAALALYEKQQQTQTLVLVAAAAAGLYLLSK